MCVQNAIINSTKFLIRHNSLWGTYMKYLDLVLFVKQPSVVHCVERASLLYTNLDIVVKKHKIILQIHYNMRSYIIHNESRFLDLHLLIVIGVPFLLSSFLPFFHIIIQQIFRFFPKSILEASHQQNMDMKMGTWSTSLISITTTSFLLNGI